MNKHSVAAFAILVLGMASPSPGHAAVEQAKDWQVKSLKGITSLKYSVGYDPDGKLTKTVTAGLAGVGVPTRAIDLKQNSTTPLSAAEGHLKVAVDDREKDQSWVGLYVIQKSKLDRNPAITYNAETYKLGTLCPKSKADAAVKELCAQFIHDFTGRGDKKAYAQ